MLKSHFFSHGGVKSPSVSVSALIWVVSLPDRPVDPQLNEQIHTYEYISKTLCQWQLELEVYSIVWWVSVCLSVWLFICIYVCRHVLYVCMHACANVDTSQWCLMVIIHSLNLAQTFTGLRWTMFWWSKVWTKCWICEHNIWITNLAQMATKSWWSNQMSRSRWAHTSDLGVVDVISPERLKRIPKNLAQTYSRLKATL